MIRRPPRSTRTDTLFPYTTLFRSTLSVGVKKLEDELGVLIFARTKSAVRLTPVGEGIVTQAQKVLAQAQRSEEHTSELQSLMRLSYAVFCLKKTTYTNTR